MELRRWTPLTLLAPARFVELAFCFEAWDPLPSHAIAFDDTHVYSSGEITAKPVEEWFANHDRYRFTLRRRVRA